MPSRPNRRAALMRPLSWLVLLLILAGWVFLGSVPSFGADSTKATKANPPQGSKHPIKPLVRKMIVGVPPAVQAFAGKSDAVQALCEMLADPAEEDHWHRAILALGTIAPYQEKLATDLIQFLETSGPFDTRFREPKPIFQTAYAAKTGVLLALANLMRKLPASLEGSGVGPVDRPTVQVHFSPPPRALSYLIEGLDPDIWTKRIAWISPPHDATDDERNRYLTQLTIQALGIYGREAIPELEYRQEKWKPGTPLGDALADALAEARRP